MIKGQGLDHRHLAHPRQYRDDPKSQPRDIAAADDNLPAIELNQTNFDVQQEDRQTIGANEEPFETAEHVSWIENFSDIFMYVVAFEK